jgi:hypothetical protein
MIRSMCGIVCSMHEGNEWNDPVARAFDREGEKVTHGCKKSEIKLFRNF